ncbi:MAG: GNAT family N-acetyltransferase [Rhizobiales bacterium]|nr:GNAT family N-acetyltransferase [Hyphomicrobiales bacterium]
MSESAVISQRRADCAAASAAHADRPAIELTIHRQLDTAETEWRTFEQSADCTAFQSFGWISAWCRHIGPLTRTQPAIVVGRQNGMTLFILPLGVTPGAVRRLTWLASDLCDYNGPLLAKECALLLTSEHFGELWRDICHRLQSDPHTRFDLVEFTKMPERVGAQANPLLALPVGLNPSNAYVSDLFGTWTEFYEAKRSSGTRRRDRTKLKRLGEIGAVRFVTPQERGEIERSVDMLIEQKSRSFARMGVANMFERPGWSEFFLAVATDPSTRHLVHVSRLDVGAAWAAINLGLVFRDTYCHVLASYDDGETARFGAGAAHLRELLCYSIEHGLKHFDFTIGDERYKSEWSDRVLTLYDHVGAASARGVMAAGVLHGHRRLKRFIKQNEALWSVFSRARAALGSKSDPAPGDDATSKIHKSPSTAPD